MPTVNDVTQINPIDVFAVATPTSTAELQDALRRTSLPVSIGGGHFSMGGHTASPGSLHLDLRQLNRVLAFAPEQRLIRVQAGIRWCDIQRFVDPHGLAVKIMQTYANFTVGGALSVNAHGRYIGLGPVVLSVRSIVLVLASGETRSASPEENADLFYAAIGGYGAIGIIAEAELELVPNTRVVRRSVKLATNAYPAWFDANVRGRADAVFHNADLYPPHYTRARAVTWHETDLPATSARLQPLRRAYLAELYFLWSISETPFGKLRREYLIDPLLFAGRKVHWRNYEAGYDTAELEPLGRRRRTYVLQEYFVPHDQLLAFIPKLAAVLDKHKVNTINISIRHASADPGTLLAWAKGETFAFVLYHKQRTRDNARERVGVWTRELIEAVLSCGGTYYLPYQLHATLEQFHRAYPGARALFALKRTLDPDYRLRGALWDKYYAPELQPATTTSMAPSLFHSVYGSAPEADKFYAFLQNIFHLYPEDRFHTLIRQATGASGDEESIYRAIQAGLPGITPPLSLLRYALPALMVQKTEIGRQTARLLGQAPLHDYVEIGSTGRYVRAMRKHLRLSGSVTTTRRRPIRRSTSSSAASSASPAASCRWTITRRSACRPGAPTWSAASSACTTWRRTGSRPSSHRSRTWSGPAAISWCATMTCATARCTTSSAWPTASSMRAWANPGPSTRPSCASSTRSTPGSHASKLRASPTPASASCRTATRRTMC
jgi:FAD/FMN-containing dehydrogenase